MLIKKIKDVESYTQDDFNKIQKSGTEKLYLTVRKSVTKLPNISITSDMDPFWSDIIQKMNNKIYPNGFKFKDSKLICGKNEYDLKNNENPQNLIHFLIENGLKKEEEEQEEIVWTQINKKIRFQMMESFIEKMIKKEKMDTDTARKFEDTVRLGFILNYFSKNNVVTDGDEIISIDDLILNTEGKYIINPSIMKKSKTTGSKTKKYNKNFIEKWYLYHNAKTINTKKKAS